MFNVIVVDGQIDNKTAVNNGDFLCCQKCPCPLNVSPHLVVHYIWTLA
jgi:hypothetical protein